jgi:hypothetical protein
LLRCEQLVGPKLDVVVQLLEATVALDDPLDEQELFVEQRLGGHSHHLAGHCSNTNHVRLEVAHVLVEGLPDLVFVLLARCHLPLHPETGRLHGILTLGRVPAQDAIAPSESVHALFTARPAHPHATSSHCP